MDWYYASGQQQQGPVSDEELARLVAAGKVKSDTLVWHSGMGDWSPYGTVAPAAAPASAETTPAPAQEAAPVQAATRSAEAPVATGGMQYCSQCNRPHRPDDLVAYQGKQICANCKPQFFQRLQEGAAPAYTGNTPNADLTAAARAHLSGYWGLAIGVIIVGNLVYLGPIAVPFVGGLGSLIIAGPLAVGLATFFLRLVREQQPEFSMLFDGFKVFGTALLAYILMLLIIPIGILLLVVPGIIASYALSQTFFIIADNPNIGAVDALRTSHEIMRGKKWKYFCLQCRFIGWSFLCVLPSTSGSYGWFRTW
jgi:uncharacterized membrane protein